MGPGTQAGPAEIDQQNTVEDLHENQAAGTPGLTPPGDDQHGFVAHSHGGPGGHRVDTDEVPVQSRAERPASFDVADFAVPTGREEDWRFTPLDRLASCTPARRRAGPAPRSRSTSRPASRPRPWPGATRGSA
jgi:hypothetical protein